jgi:hypothetical protein
MFKSNIQTKAQAARLRYLKSHVNHQKSRSLQEQERAQAESDRARLKFYSIYENQKDLTSDY